MSVGRSERKQRIVFCGGTGNAEKLIKLKYRKTEHSTSDGRDYTEKKKSTKRNVQSHHGLNERYQTLAKMGEPHVMTKPL